LKLPIVSGRKLLIFLKKLDYEIIRQRGSHVRPRKMTLLGEHNITVPYHDEIAKGTLNSILSSLSRGNNIPKDELIDILRRDC